MVTSRFAPLASRRVAAALAAVAIVFALLVASAPGPSRGSTTASVPTPIGDPFRWDTEG